ncbi:MAG: ATP-binding protein [Bacteroidota bacterium]|nr:ATP-binding protein [Bacteroidota bacterium]
MRKTKLNELEPIYNTAVRALLCDILPENDPIPVQNVNGHFTYLTENDTIPDMVNFDIPELSALIKRKQKLNKALKISVGVVPVLRKISQNKSSAVFMDEFHITSTLDEITQKLLLRVTVLMELFEDKWHIVHIHPSTSGNKKEEVTTMPDEASNSMNHELKKIVADLTAALNESQEMLKVNQAQLVKQEKLASLGQLSAGIAHEIKNPLNFINNFSELSIEYIDEVFEEFVKLDENPVVENIITLLKDVKLNLKKINQHSTRVETIVKSMLLHSRGSNGTLEPTYLNGLIKEYVNLAFHGMRANRDPINVHIQLGLDENIDKANINPEGFSRVILNLCKNAFDAMRDKVKKEEESPLSDKNYLPKLTIATKKEEGYIKISFEDNGPGIPDEIKDKILQPFFTTKKGTAGTGLGLSISHDIIKAHNGTLQINSQSEKFTIFTILLPIPIK